MVERKRKWQKELVDPSDDIRAYGADYVHFCMRLRKLRGLTFPRTSHGRCTGGSRTIM